MVEDDVMILDSGDEVYVWLGNDSDVQERKEALKLAKVSYNLFETFYATYSRILFLQIDFIVTTVHFNFLYRFRITLTRIQLRGIQQIL